MATTDRRDGVFQRTELIAPAAALSYDEVGRVLGENLRRSKIKFISAASGWTIETGRHVCRLSANHVNERLRLRVRYSSPFVGLGEGLAIGFTCVASVVALVVLGSSPLLAKWLAKWLATIAALVAAHFLLRLLKVGSLVSEILERARESVAVAVDAEVDVGSRHN